MWTSDPGHSSNETGASIGSVPNEVSPLDRAVVAMARLAQQIWWSERAADRQGRRNAHQRTLLQALPERHAGAVGCLRMLALRNCTRMRIGCQQACLSCQLVPMASFTDETNAAKETRVKSPFATKHGPC